MYNFLHGAAHRQTNRPDRITSALVQVIKQLVKLFYFSSGYNCKIKKTCKTVVGFHSRLQLN